MAKISLTDVLALSVAERIQLVQEIWDSITEIPDAVTLGEEEKKELTRRLAEHRANPESGIPWDEVKKRIGL